jgi:hypothetical protein
MQGHCHCLPYGQKPNLNINPNGISHAVSHNRIQARVKVKEEWATYVGKIEEET